MEPQPDFEAIKQESETALPRRTAKDVKRALWQGAKMAFYGLQTIGLVPPERPPSHRLSHDRYEQILAEFQHIDAETVNQTRQAQAEKLMEE